MRSGRLVAELAGPDMTEEAIVGAAFGTTIVERRMSAEAVGTERPASRSSQRAGRLVGRAGILIPFLIAFVGAQPDQPAVPAVSGT